ncbi:MAG: hypothetical protein LBH75_04555 [Treponema sp.]|jgi:hypothetical protein|nr:hypothetical protein [Treponema sp.]
MVKTKLIYIFFFIQIQTQAISAEPVRVFIEGNLLVSLDNIAGTSIPLSYTGSTIIALSEDIRFFRGVELNLTVPQAYLAYRGGLTVGVYTGLELLPNTGAADIEASRIFFDVLPNKIQTIYQIPLREDHGLRTSPYVTTLNRVSVDAFPILFRITPAMKGMGEEIEKMRFTLNAKPIMSNEGALNLSFRYPEQLSGKPFSLLIDDVLIENVNGEMLLKEGSHHLVVVSEYFRNENRLFFIERGKTLSLTVELQDPTPILVFEAPGDARIYIDGVYVNPSRPLPVEPGQHEIKFLMSDYSIVRPIVVRKGKTYKVVMTVAVDVSESE